MRSRFIAASGALAIVLALAVPSAAVAAPMTATIFVSDNALRIGDTATVTFVFDQVVRDFTEADVTAPNAVLSTPTSADGGMTWTATLTPTAGTEDTSNVLTLDLTGVTDLGGIPGGGSVDSPVYAVDTIRPLATSIAFSDTVLSAGTTATVTFVFTEAITGFTADNVTAPNASLAGLGTADGITWAATLIPDRSVSVGSNMLTLDYTGIADAAGNTGVGMVSSGNYAVSTVTPTGTITLSSTALRHGDSATVTFTFSEPVFGFTTADVTTPNGTLHDLRTNDGIVWFATLTPTADTDSAAHWLTLDLTGIANASGNVGTGTVPSVSYAIDTLLPTATISLGNTVLGIGATSTVTFAFSEAVTGLTTADITTPGASISPPATSDGGVTWTATLTPDDDTTAPAAAVVLNLAGVADLVGNVGSGTARSGPFTIDTERPTATISLSDTDLRFGETATVTLTFSERVMGVATSDLTVSNGTLSTATTADGGITWVTTLTPTPDRTAPTNVVVLDLTGITDTAGNAGVGTASSAAFAVDTVVPTPTPTPSVPAPIIAAPDNAPTTTSADVAGDRLPVTGVAHLGLLQLGFALSTAGILLTLVRRRWTGGVSAA